MQSLQESKQKPLPPPTPSKTPFVKSPSIQWQPFKQGAYNQLYIAESNSTWWVQKFAKKINAISSKLSEPSRFLRKNTLINHNRLPAFINKGYHVRLARPPTDGNLQQFVIYLYHSSNEKIIVCYIKDRQTIVHESIEERLYYDLWRHTKHALRLRILPLTIENALIDFLKLKRDSLVMPYAGREMPNDPMIAKYVLDVYKNTRNIVLDACIPGNLLIYENQIICVDFDCVFEKGSVISDEFMSDADHINSIQHFLNMHLIQNINPITATICLNLLYLEKNLPMEVIHHDIFTPDNFILIDHFRRMKVRLTPEHLSKIKVITETFPNFNDYKHLITPHFLSFIPFEQTIQSKFIYRLLMHEKNELAIKSNLSKHRFNLFHWDKPSPLHINAHRQISFHYVAK